MTLEQQLQQHFKGKLKPLGGGFAKTYKFEGPDPLFVKVGPREMLEGEYESLRAIDAAVPGLVPKPLAFGVVDSHASKYYLASEFLEFRGRPDPKQLAAMLARLHTTPQPQFGFKVPTCCGETVQPNTPKDTWPEYFSSMLRNVQSSDPQLVDAIDKTTKIVVPQLLDSSIKPVLVHGDLWSGNVCGTARGPRIFDPSAFCGHSEFDFGIMQMFGGFGAVATEYHKLVPKSEPAEQYEDRVQLYEAYHHLNHHLMFGGYKGGALSILNSLIAKYQ